MAESPQMQASRERYARIQELMRQDRLECRKYGVDDVSWVKRMAMCTLSCCPEQPHERGILN